MKEFQGKSTLVEVSESSSYRELIVAKLPDTMSTTVIAHFKSAFARHGIPSVVLRDNGPRYSSKELKTFAKHLMGVQSHYHQSTWPSSKCACWKNIANSEKFANQSKARQSWSIPGTTRIQKHNYRWHWITWKCDPRTFVRHLHVHLYSGSHCRIVKIV